MDKLLEKEKRERWGNAGKIVEESTKRKREIMGEEGRIERQKEEIFKRNYKLVRKGNERGNERIYEGVGGGINGRSERRNESNK